MNPDETVHAYVDGKLIECFLSIGGVESASLFEPCDEQGDRLFKIRRYGKEAYVLVTDEDLGVIANTMDYSLLTYKLDGALPCPDCKTPGEERTPPCRTCM